MTAHSIQYMGQQKLTLVVGVIHEYFGVDLKIIWNVVKERIPVLKPIFEKIRKDYDD